MTGPTITPFVADTLSSDPILRLLARAHDTLNELRLDHASNRRHAAAAAHLAVGTAIDLLRAERTLEPRKTEART